MKIICDVCGTTFSETATHCPICGCAKSPAAKTIPGDDVQANQGASTANTYARGGRFSKGNVQRSSQSRASEGRYTPDRNRRNETPETNKGLIAVVVVLLLAIILVVVYIGVNVLSNLGGTTNNGGNNPGTSSYQQNNGDQTVSCTSITLGVKLHEFTSETDQLLLSVRREPENTTDPLIFMSSDPEIATVDANGLIQPGTVQGEATITVICGSISETCQIISTVGELSEPPAPEVPEVNLPAGFILKLETYKDSGEITIAAEGASHQLYKESMGVKASDITWTSSNPAVAKVENGKVIGVDRGTCTITATIGDQTATCLVRCPFDAAPETDYQLSHASVTIAQGETFNLSLKSKETGANVQGIEWQANPADAVIINGNKITGGTVTKLTAVDVFTEYEGVTYTCKVYVKAPAT